MEELKRFKKELEELCANTKGIKTTAVHKWAKEHADVLDFYITTENGYWDIKIYSKTLPHSQGYLRAYEDTRRNEMHFQLWTPCEMKYSGISTFPSARYR